MNALDPEGLSLLSKVVAAAGAIIVPSWVGWNWLDKRFARKHAVASDLQAVRNEVATQRLEQGKLFDRIEGHSLRDEELFRQVMAKMSANHVEIMRELGKKADRK